MARTSRFSRLFSLRKKQIDSAFSISQRVARMPGIKVLYAPSPEPQDESRVLVVPTRTFKGHVTRNKVRRRIKAIIYENQLATQCPGTFIILLYQDAAQLTFEQIKFFLKRTFAKVTG